LRDRRPAGPRAVLAVAHDRGTAQVRGRDQPDDLLAAVDELGELARERVAQGHEPLPIE